MNHICTLELDNQCPNQIIIEGKRQCASNNHICAFFSKINEAKKEGKPAEKKEKWFDKYHPGTIYR